MKKYTWIDVRNTAKALNGHFLGRLEHVREALEKGIMQISEIEGLDPEYAMSPGGPYFDLSKEANEVFCFVNNAYLNICQPLSFKQKLNTPTIHDVHSLVKLILLMKFPYITPEEGLLEDLMRLTVDIPKTMEISGKQFREFESTDTELNHEAHKIYDEMIAKYLL